MNDSGFRITQIPPVGEKRVELGKEIDHVCPVSLKNFIWNFLFK